MSDTVTVINRSAWPSPEWSESSPHGWLYRWQAGQLWRKGNGDDAGPGERCDNAGEDCDFVATLKGAPE